MDHSFEQDDTPFFDLGDAASEIKGPPAGDYTDMLGLSRVPTAGLSDE